MVDHRKPVQRGERRRFERWETSIPCTVEWEGWSTTGRITNLSFGGALIKRVDATPPEGTRAIIRFEVKKEGLRLKGSLVAKIIRIFQEFKEEGEGMVWLGVQFEGPAEEIKAQLIPALQNPFSEDDG